MDTALFDFTLPQEQIALRPCHPRDLSRLLVIPKNYNQKIIFKSCSHSYRSYRETVFRNIDQFFCEGDALVFNNTKVIPARLLGCRYRREHRAKIEILLDRPTENKDNCTTWLCLAKPGRRLRVDDDIIFNCNCSNDTLLGNIVAIDHCKKNFLIHFQKNSKELLEIINRFGQVPIPPYIAKKRAYDEKDDSDYQTIYAKNKGAVAAPTAGLHFTNRVLQKLRQKGVILVEVTLHVGAGTFLPVTVSETNQHIMHEEWGTLTNANAKILNCVKNSGKKVIAVGTTSLRLLESSIKNGIFEPFDSLANIFIQPGYDWKAVDGLLTNFHLPRSTLFMLVCAMTGIKEAKEAYRYAIEQNFRFYSYGDALLII